MGRVPIRAAPQHLGGFATAIDGRRRRVAAAPWRAEDVERDLRDSRPVRPLVEPSPRPPISAPERAMRSGWAALLH